MQRITSKPHAAWNSVGRILSWVMWSIHCAWLLDGVRAESVRDRVLWDCIYVGWLVRVCPFGITRVLTRREGRGRDAIFRRHGFCLCGGGHFHEHGEAQLRPWASMGYDSIKLGVREPWHERTDRDSIVFVILHVQKNHLKIQHFLFVLFTSMNACPSICEIVVLA